MKTLNASHLSVHLVLHHSIRVQSSCFYKVEYTLHQPGTRVWYTVSSLVFFQPLQIVQLICIKGEMKIKKSGSAHLDFDTRGASYVGTTGRS